TSRGGGSRNRPRTALRAGPPTPARSGAPRGRPRPRPTDRARPAEEPGGAEAWERGGGVFAARCGGSETGLFFQRPAFGAHAMSLPPPLIDTQGRVVRDLRISVPDRCNLRCVYCMPAEGMPWLPKEQLLTYEEIARFARLCLDLGVTCIRLTGGEPTVRAD